VHVLDDDAGLLSDAIHLALGRVISAVTRELWLPVKERLLSPSAPEFQCGVAQYSSANRASVMHAPRFYSAASLT
jgi:hypothetical protein